MVRRPTVVGRGGTRWYGRIMVRGEEEVFRIIARRFGKDQWRNQQVFRDDRGTEDIFSGHLVVALSRAAHTQKVLRSTRSTKEMLNKHLCHKAYQMPGSMVYRFFGYFDPSSFRYLCSFFFAQRAICPTATIMNTAVLQD